MATTVKCPKCAADIPIGALSAGGDVQCPGCGKRLKVKASRRVDEAASGNAPQPAAKENDVYSLAGRSDLLGTPQALGELGGSSDLSRLDAPPGSASPMMKLPSTRPPSQAKKSPKQKPQTRGARAPGKRSPQTLILCAAGGGLALLLLVGGLVVALRGNGEKQLASAAAVSDSAAKPPELQPVNESQFVVVDAPVNLDEFPLETQSTLPARQGRDAGRTSIGATTADAAATDAAATNAPAAEPSSPASGEPLWNLPVDLPDTAPEPVAEDLNLPLAEPTFAGLDGPFILGPWKTVEPPKSRARSKEQVAQKFETPLIDLRTGETAGVYKGPPALATQQRLSPDGKLLITPGRMNDEDKTSEGILYCWRPGAEKPQAEIRMPGQVGWLEFVAPTQIAMFAADPGAVQRFAGGGEDVRAVLQVSDAETGKVVKTIPLTLDTFLPAGARNRRENGSEYLFAPDTMPGAVSPTGKYVVLPGRTGLVLVSIAEGKEIGHMPLPGAEWAFGRGMGIGFSPDGAQLYVVANLHLMVWDMATGRIVIDRKAENLPHLRPLAGPDRDTVLCGEFVVDLFSGLTVYRVGCIPQRWSGGERLLAIKRTPDNASLLCLPFDRDSYLASAAQASGGVVRRPPVVAVDRNGITAQTPQPPDAWAAPPTATPKAVASSRRLLVDWPMAMGDEIAVSASFRYTNSGSPFGRNELLAQRIDLKTAQPIGEAALLWPWTSDPTTYAAQHNEQNPAPRMLAALTADGVRLAVRDPANSRRVDAWSEDGSRIGGLEPYASAPIDWIGWSGEAKLLTLGGGTLGAWDIASGKAFYEVAGDYQAIVDYGPGRQWLAIASGRAVDLLDAETGQCLGRCRADDADESYEKLAVSPDGKWLLAVRPGELPPQPGTTQETDLVADLWDLASGQRKSIPLGARPLEFVAWKSPKEALVVSSTFIDLIDTAFGEVVWHGWLYPDPFGSYPEKSIPYARATPDGQLWLRVRNADWKPGLPKDVWHSQIVPNAKLDGGQMEIASGDEQLAVDKIRIEVDLGEKSRSDKTARQAAAGLQRLGFTIAPGGWTLRLTQTSEKTKETIKFELLGSVAEMPIPKVIGVWQLLAPDGQAAWQAVHERRWIPDTSGYADRNSVAALNDVSRDVLVRLDFKGRNPQEAILEELLTGIVKLPQGVPVRLLKSKGKFQALPIVEQLNVDYGKSP